jgi:hypothetical protein
MTPAEVLAATQEAGAVLTAHGGQLVVEADAPLPDELVAAIRGHKAELLVLLDEPTTWNEAVADAWVAITLERIGRLHDELAPDCDIATPEWDRAEAVVSAAYLLKNRQALRNALDAYEVFAHAAFEAWAKREVA